MMRAEQPGSQPLDIPEQVPNPAYTPKKEPVPEPVPSEPVRVPERVSHKNPRRVARGFLMTLLEKSARATVAFFTDTERLNDAVLLLTCDKDHITDCKTSRCCATIVLRKNHGECCG